MPPHLADEVLDVVPLVPDQGNLDDHRQGETGLAGVRDYGIAVDDAGLLEALHPAPAGRTRHPGPLAEFLHRQPAIVLQLRKNLPVFRL